MIIIEIIIAQPFKIQTPMMNKVVQDYILMQSVGKGQYGNVYRAEHRKTKQIFAVKVMSIDKFKHTPKLSQFTNNEIAILTKISHPNIIKFIQMLRTNNNYYLVYEYCSGGTLGDYIKVKKRLSEDQSLRIFAQLRSAFQTLTKNQILHRDLKPTNILFHNGLVKIADFGFCKEMLNNQLTQTMVGSPIYMAPEVLKGSVYDNRADVWSLGVILYQMIYGFCPYEQSSIVNLINLIDNTILKFPSQIPISTSTKTLLKKMMTVKYRSRMTANQLLSYPLQIKQGPDTPLKIGNVNQVKQQQQQLNYNYVDVVTLNRKWLCYLFQTVDYFVGKIQREEKYGVGCFLVFKIFQSCHKNLQKSSPYWQTISLPPPATPFDTILKSESDKIDPFGPLIRQLLQNSGPTLPLKLELETHYVDLKFYMHILADFINDSEARLRLLNCMLIYRHFLMAEEKGVVDFTDVLEAKRGLDQKEQICKKFAYMRV